MMINMGTIAPPLRFNAGFSWGNARDNIEGSIRIGIEISKQISSQDFDLSKLLDKNHQSIKEKNRRYDI